MHGYIKQTHTHTYTNTYRAHTTYFYISFQQTKQKKKDRKGQNKTKQNKTKQNKKQKAKAKLTNMHKKRAKAGCHTILSGMK
jgi:hypothetical protein